MDDDPQPPRTRPATGRPSRRGLAVAVVVATAVACGGGSDGGGELAAPDPDRGATLWASSCAVCHGPQGEGTTVGPPLVHEVYEPGHHSDESFQLAVANGVQPHHWNFGPMPAIPGLDRQDVADITAYVRDLQRAAGIID